MNGHVEHTSPRSTPNGDTSSAPDIGISDAMLERMIERKLAMLDNEYEACVNAVPANEPPQEWSDGNDPTWSDLNDTSSDDDTPTPYEHHSDEEKTNDTVDVHAYTQIQAVRDGEQNIVQNNDIADWDAFRDSSQPPTTEPEEEYEPAYRATPMSAEHVNKIKTMMSSVKLKPPPWAVGVPDEVWMSRILQHAGFRAPPPTTTSSTSTSTSTSTEQNKKKKKKKKPKKSKPSVFSAEEEDGFGQFGEFESATPSTTTTTTTTATTTTTIETSTSTPAVATTETSTTATETSISTPTSSSLVT